MESDFKTVCVNFFTPRSEEKHLKQLDLAFVYVQTAFLVKWFLSSFKSTISRPFHPFLIWEKQCEAAQRRYAISSLLCFKNSTSKTISFGFVGKATKARSGRTRTLNLSNLMDYVYQPQFESRYSEICDGLHFETISVLSEAVWNGSHSRAVGWCNQPQNGGKKSCRLRLHMRKRLLQWDCWEKNVKDNRFKCT